MQTVLVVEDDTKTQNIYLEKLKLEKFDVMLAASGNQGITLARKHKPDLILLDIMLRNKLNGFDVLEELKRQPETRSIPVLVLTNLGTEEKVAKDIGATEYLIKANTSLDQLIDKIRSTLKRN